MTYIKSNKTLNELARNIESHAEKSDEHVIQAAMLMREARQRVENKEAGDVTWCEWARKNINLKTTRLREIHRIAIAENPAWEIERQRELIRKRVENHRDKKKAEKTRKLDEERCELIAWAKTAPIEHVKYIRQQAICLADQIQIKLIEANSNTKTQPAA